jgi:very-short-patch-repair endonuclease
MQRNTALKSTSRSLRKEMTKEENLLWYRFLRKYPTQFRRQYIIGNYIVDFYCHGARLAVELDGSQHYETEEQLRDLQRTNYLNEQGVEVLRFTNLQVLRDFDAVCAHIHSAVQHRTPIPSPGGKVAARRADG